MRKGTIEYLNEGLVFFKELRTKYNNKFSLTEITSQLTAITTSEQGNHNRQFIDSHREEKGTDMDWDEYFEAVKKKCLFKRYTKYHSVESANSGAKKKRSKNIRVILLRKQASNDDADCNIFLTIFELLSICLGVRNGYIAFLHEKF